MTKPSLGKLGALITDTKKAFASNIGDPAAPPDWDDLRARVRRAGKRLPSAYRWSVTAPFHDKLRTLPAATRGRFDGYIDDLALAHLARAPGPRRAATRAFQEVVSDVYDGFFSAADRAGARLPDHDVLAPLVKWGTGEDGPYTWPDDEAWDINAGIVALPTSHATAALAGWTVLAHETAGHDILGANADLKAELAERTKEALHGHPAWLRSYWEKRIEETASDVVGVLNMGPAAGVGLLAYFRGWNARDGYGRRLLTAESKAFDEHPLEVLRGFLVAEVTRLLPFRHAEHWADALTRKVLDDCKGRQIRPSARVIELEDARNCAAVVARTIALRELDALDGFCLSHIQSWRDRDEAIVDRLRTSVQGTGNVPRRYAKDYYAAHVVSAAVLEVAASGHADERFATMVKMLGRMHNASRVWEGS